MDGDDLTGLLPKSPPPRPVRREAAIAAAMRRFDGVADAPAEPERPRTSPGKARWGQIGAFASILLVAAISIPLALRTPSLQPSGPAPAPPAIEREASTGAQQPTQSAIPTRDAAPPAGKPRAAPAANIVTVPAPAIEAATPASEAAKREAQASRFEQAPSLHAAPPPITAAPAPPPPPGAPAPVAEAKASAPSAEPSIVVTGSRIRRPAMESPTPVTLVEKGATADDGDIVVSGTRSVRPRGAARRGDWNACTVIDPEQSLRGCRRLVNPAAKGTAGTAAARLADGLELAWQQDWGGAIAAFDRAIALKPKLAFAYLNRGLAHQRKGELAHAEADLDRAVRHAPYTARGYYHRGLVRRLRGEARRASADMARAADLDPRYDAVIE